MADTPARFKPVRQAILAGHQAGEIRMDLVLTGRQFPLQLSKIDGIAGMDQQRFQPG